MALQQAPHANPAEVISESEPVAKTGTPTQWWSYGLIGLGVVIALLLIMQLLMGAPGTAVQSGTPTAAPVVETPAPPQPSTDGQ